MHPSSDTDITLFLGGDVMAGRGIDQVLPESSNPVLYERVIKNAEDYVKLAERSSGPISKPVSYRYIWGEAFEELKAIAPDVKIINLETAVTTNNNCWPGKGIHYRMHPGNVNLLTQSGIDVCVMANNHCIDWGYAGLRESIEVLNANGLLTAGAGADSKAVESPAVMELKRGRLLVFSYTTTDSGTPLEWEAQKDKPGVNLLKSLGTKGVQKVYDDVNLYRRKGDRILLSIHWGKNWGNKVPETHRRFARQVVDSGCADLIHGHSSHHPKAIEVYRGRLIMYGCGDLINDYEGIRGHEAYRDDLSLLYFPVLDDAGRLTSMTITPMEIFRFSLHRASEEDRTWLVKQLNALCRAFETQIKPIGAGRLELSWID